MADESEFSRNMQDIAEKVSELAAGKTVPLTDVLSDAFMRAHTSFASFQAMADASGVEDAGRCTAENPQWQAHVRATTQFAGWDEMLGTASKAWAAEQLK